MALAARMNEAAWRPVELITATVLGDMGHRAWRAWTWGEGFSGGGGRMVAVEEEEAEEVVAAVKVAVEAAVEEAVGVAVDDGIPRRGGGRRVAGARARASLPSRPSLLPRLLAWLL